MRTSWRLAVDALVALALLSASAVEIWGGDPAGNGWGGPPAVACLLALLAAGSVVARVRRPLEDVAAQLVEERDERARVAVASERARIAREMHDVIAHNVSVMVVHAGAASRLLEGEVAVRYMPDALELAVVDDGDGNGAGGGTGHGLVGMAERVALYDGELEAGARPEGGYAVRARLPYHGGPRA